MISNQLTDKQQRFCEEYVIDLNGTQAAIRAGYSEKTANVISSQNLTKLNIQEYIKNLQANISKTTGVTAIMIVNELKKLAFTNLSDFKLDWYTLEDFDNLPDDKKAAIMEITTIETTFGIDGEKKQLKFKLHDKIKAIDTLNKMLGFNAPEKIDQTIKEVPQDLSKISTDELKQRIAKAKDLSRTRERGNKEGD